MTKTIDKIGDAKGIILDPAIPKRAQLDVGDEVIIEVQPDGTLVIAPVSGKQGGPPSNADVTAAIQETMRDYKGALTKLAQ